MGSAMTIGLIAGGMGALSGLGQAERSRNQQLAQASAAESQAAQLRAQAKQEAQRGEAQARALDNEKKKLRREFQDVQGRNRSMLAAGNVDMTSGSALDVSLGNIDTFAADMGDNAYERAMALWEADTRRKATNYAADVQDANASYLKRTAGNLGTSVLTGLMSGVGGFASGYTLAGGKLTELFQSTQTSRVWDETTSTGGIILHHANGKKTSYVPAYLLQK